MNRCFTEILENPVKVDEKILENLLFERKQKLPKGVFVILSNFLLEENFSRSLFCFHACGEWNTSCVATFGGDDHVCWPTEH